MPEYSSISQRVFGFVPKNALVLAGGDYVRPLFFGKSWGRVRIGVLCSVTPSGVASDQNIVDAPFYIGLCAGNDAPVGYEVTRSFIGICATGDPLTAGGGGNTLTYSSTYKTYTGATFSYIRKINEYMTRTTTSSKTIAFAPAGTELWPNTRRFPIYVDIERRYAGPYPSGVGWYTTVYYINYNAAYHALTDYRPHEFLAGLDHQGVPVLQGNTLLDSGAVAVNGSNMLGYLDTLNLYWKNQACPLEIHALGVSVAYQQANIATPSIKYFTPMTGGYLRMDNGYPNGTITSLSNGTAFTGAVYFPQVGSTWGNANPMVNTQGTYDGTWYPYTGTYWTAMFAGTSIGFPRDNFEMYSVGSLTSLASGSNWGAAGVIV